MGIIVFKCGSQRLELAHNDSLRLVRLDRSALDLFLIVRPEPHAALWRAASFHATGGSVRSQLSGPDTLVGTSSQASPAASTQLMPASLVTTMVHVPRAEM